VTAPLGTSVPFFTVLPFSFAPATVQLSTFVDPADVPFSMAHLLGSFINPPVFVHQPTPFGPLAAPYSLTQEYTITPTTNAQALAVALLDVAAAPEPSTWAMMLIGFAGLGFAFRKSRRRMSFA
jgi:hypothetical protein